VSGICNPVAAGRHHLTDEEVGAFLARARRLGHDPSRLLAGEVTETLTSIPALEQVRQLSQVSPAERRARQAVFFHPAIAIRSRLGQGVHDRCEAYVFADASIDDADRDRLAMHLPFPARLLSVLYRRVAAAEVWDLTMEHRVLGIDERDDLFNVVNVGELVIEPGGRVIVQGNLLVLGCQHLRHRRQPGKPGTTSSASCRRRARWTAGPARCTAWPAGRAPTARPVPEITSVGTYTQGALVYFDIHYADPGNDAEGFGFVGVNGSGWAEENHPFTSPSYGIVGPGSIAYPFNEACGTAQQSDSYVEAWIYDTAGDRSTPVVIHLVCAS
jgi:hypothetical protein